MPETAEATITLTDYEFVPRYECEDRRAHANGQAHHDPTQPASYHMIAPCCGSRALICKARRDYLTGPTCGDIHCTRCDLMHPPGTYRFELLPD
jgi:hypothetical protein